MKSRKKKLENRVRRTTATNDRKTVYKYYPLDEKMSYSVKVGRCVKCGRITDASCDVCGRYMCENHLKDDRCLGCMAKKVKIDYVG